MNKPKLLALIQLPPPIHGAAVMNQIVVGSKIIGSQFSIDVIPLQFASSIRDLSKLRIGKFTKTFSIALQLIKALLTTKYDLVYFTLSPVGFAFYRDVLFVSILKLFRVKILYHLHGKGIKEKAENSRIKKRLYRYTFRKSSVIVLAKILARDIETVYSGTPFIVNNGIPVVPFSEKYENEIKEPIHLLYLSNLVRTKGIMVFIKALCLLHKKEIPFKASIVGNDSSTVTFSDAQQELAKYGLDNLVSILGPKYGDEKYRIFSRADIFCFPTYKEAFPLVLLEAMQLGKAVVSTYEGGIPEIIDHNINGLLVAQQDVDELANALQRLIEDNKIREQMGKSARDKFIYNYTIDIFERNIRDTFKIVVSDG